jgi:hypothetical protein
MTMTDIPINPGVRGMTRSTWIDDTHLRGLLMRLIREHPSASQKEIAPIYLAYVRNDSSLIDEAAMRVLDNDWASIHKAPKSHRPIFSAAQLAAGRERLQTCVLLDLMMPNDKKLRDCTGTECGEFGGWLIKIRDRVGAGIVGEILSEEETRGILEGRSTEG